MALLSPRRYALKGVPGRPCGLMGPGYISALSPFIDAAYRNQSMSLGADPASTPNGRRILVVEDEFLIRMLLEDMLTDLGYELVGVAGRVDEAAELAKTKDFDLAILDVNLDGHDVYPVAELIGKRGLPFMFVTGYGGRGLPDSYRDRPTLQKPFQLDELKKMLAQLLPA
jgi:CheY-like chemotaxis protein